MEQIHNILTIHNIPQELHYKIIIYSNLENTHCLHIKDLVILYSVYLNYDKDKRNQKSFIEYLNYPHFITEDRWKHYRKSTTKNQTTFLNKIR